MVNFRFSILKIGIFMFFSIISLCFAGTSQSDEIQMCKEKSKIDEPSHKDKGVGFPLAVKGKASNCPKGYHFWIAVHPVLSSGYWPQSGEISPSPRDDSWETVVYLGEAKKGIGEKFQIILAIADENAHKSFVKYLADAPKEGYPERPMPDGVIQIDRITYTRTQ